MYPPGLHSVPSSVRA